MSAPEFVAIGHVTLDRFGDVVRPGGAALYAAVTAHRLGLSAGILTSHAGDFPLDLVPPRIEVVSVPASRTTVFRHDPADGGRRMIVEATAVPVAARDVPEDWGDADVVLLAPVLDEVDPMVVTAFPDAAVGAAVQGWLRRLGARGEVMPTAWTPPPELLARLQVLFASAEDVRGQEPSLIEWIQRLPLAVMTAGGAGALLYVNGDRYEVRPRPVREVDATGAGDVFAAAFLVEYRRGGDPWRAAAAATVAASLSIEGASFEAVPGRPLLATALAEYLGQ